MNYEAAVEAILFAAGDAVEAETIEKALDVDSKTLKNIIEDMKNKLSSGDRGLKIIELDGAYQLCTKPETHETLIKVVKQPKKQALTQVLLETLSIIAYRQPVTKADIEKIRGVKSDHAVNRLIEYELVEEKGRMEAPGRPILFGTTEEFLRRFGASSADALPEINPDQVEKFRIEAENEAQSVDAEIKPDDGKIPD